MSWISNQQKIAKSSSLSNRKMYKMSCRSSYTLEDSVCVCRLCLYVPACLYLTTRHVCVCESLSHVRLSATQQTVARQASLSMEFFRQDSWSGLPFPASGDLPDPGVEPRFSAFFTIWATREALLTAVCAWLLSHIQPSVTPWTTVRQPPLSMWILQARILEWVAVPSTRRSSQARDQTQLSCTAGGFFTFWATRE